MEITDAMISSVIWQLRRVSQAEAAADDLQRLLEVMMARLRSINSVLVEDLNRKTTLADIRKLMYEADDIVTDCLIRQEYHKNGFCSKFSLMGFLLRRQTAMKIKDINRKMKEVEIILGNHVKIEYGRSGKSYKDDDDDNIEQFMRWDYDPSPEIIGLESDVTKIKLWILERDYKLQKIGIVGMGGLGKTTIAKLIFNDSDVRHHFEEKIWVSVSSSFRVGEILRSILQQSGEKSEKDHSYVHDDLHKIISLLRKKKFLLILDDIWENGLEWWMKFLSQLSESSVSETTRSCIIITTRNKEVASAIGIYHIHEPNLLNDAESWSLFSKHAFPKIKEGYLEKFEAIGKRVLAECRGLPLAIKTIGGILGSKPGSLTAWEGILECFFETEITAVNATSMTSLRLSYKALPSHLKLCLLCFSIYPEDFLIEAEKLIYWWIAEGLVQGKDSKTATELGFEYLSKLINRSLVDVVDRRGYDGRVCTCKMHDLVRHLTLIIAQDEKFCSFDDRGRQKLTQDSRWLGFTTEMDAESLNRTPNLRALLQMTRGGQIASFISSLSSLRTLDLSYTNLDRIALKKVLSWISSLKRLAYLNLSGAEGLEEVPCSIRKLQNLQLLVLRGCINLSKLSPSIIYLKKLIVLDLGSCDKLPHLPRGLGRLSQLQELSGLRLVGKANRGSCSLLELAELGELRVLRMILCNDAQIKGEERDVLSKLHKLKVLAIDFDNKNSEKKSMKELLDHMPPQELLDRMSPPTELKELYLRRYYHETLPKWVSPESLPTLTYLCIEEAGLLDISTRTHTIWKLDGLCLKSLPHLNKDWNELKEQMPFLCYAEVKGCPQLSNFPFAKGNKAIDLEEE